MTPHWLDHLPDELAEMVHDIAAYVLEPTEARRRQVERHRDVLEGELRERAALAEMERRTRRGLGIPAGVGRLDAGRTAVVGG